MRFLPKDVTIYYKKEGRFDYKNNNGYNEQATYELNTIS